MQETLFSLKTLFEVIFIYAVPLIFIIYVVLAWTGYSKKLGEWVLNNTTQITQTVNNVVILLNTFFTWSCKLTPKIVSTVILVLYIVLIVLYFVYLA